MGSDRWGNRRPSIIHAVHGVSENGDWFLLAQVEDDASGQPHGAPADSDDGWLVMLGRDDRDIITIHGQPA